jgi:hypothetical protein
MGVQHLELSHLSKKHTVAGAAKPVVFQPAHANSAASYSTNTRPNTSLQRIKIITQAIGRPSVRPRHNGRTSSARHALFGALPRPQANRWLTVLHAHTTGVHRRTQGTAHRSACRPTTDTTEHESTPSCCWRNKPSSKSAVRPTSARAQRRPAHASCSF